MKRTWGEYRIPKKTNSQKNNQISSSIHCQKVVRNYESCDVANDIEKDQESEEFGVGLLAFYRSQEEQEEYRRQKEQEIR